MNKLLRFFFASLGALGIVATGLTPISAFAVEKSTKETVKEAKTAKPAKVDINHASEQELEALPGVGAVYAKKIIENRPFRKRADLVKIGIPQKTVDNLKGQIKFGKIEKAKKKSSRKKETRSKRDKSEVDTKTEKEKKSAHHNERKAEAKTEVEKRPAVKRAESARTETIPEAKAQTRSERETVKAPQKGMVWVNTNSMVYHREGDQWYGNTEKGEYMTEDDAIKFGAHLSKHN